MLPPYQADSLLKVSGITRDNVELARYPVKGCASSFLLHPVLSYKGWASHFLGEYEACLRVHHTGLRRAPRHKKAEFRNGIR